MKEDLRWHGDALEKVTLDMHSQYPAEGRTEKFEGEVEPPQEIAAHPGRAPQQISVRQADWMKFGSTPGCIKCTRADNHGWGKMGGPHSAACVERITKLLNESVAERRRVEETERRQTEWWARQIQSQENPPREQTEVPQHFQNREETRRHSAEDDRGDEAMQQEGPQDADDRDEQGGVSMEDDDAPSVAPTSPAESDEGGMEDSIGALMDITTEDVQKELKAHNEEIMEVILSLGSAGLG